MVTCFENVRVEILLYQENMWLTQAKMAELFEVQKAAISKRLKKYLKLENLWRKQLFPKWKQLLLTGNHITQRFCIDNKNCIGIYRNKEFTKEDRE